MHETEVSREHSVYHRVDKVREFVADAQNKTNAVREAANDYQAHIIQEFQTIVDINQGINLAQKRAQEQQKERLDYLTEKEAVKVSAAAEKLKRQKEVYRDNLNKIKERSRRNDEIIKEIHDRNKDNLEKRKEIMHLRKLD